MPIENTVVVVEGITPAAAAYSGWTNGGWVLRGLVLGGSGRCGILIFYFFFNFFFYFYYLYSSHRMRHSIFVFSIYCHICIRKKCVSLSLHFSHATIIAVEVTTQCNSTCSRVADLFYMLQRNDLQLTWRQRLALYFI